MRSRSLAIFALILASLLAACSSAKRGSTKLFEEIPSNSTRQQVKAQLHLERLGNGWTEKVDKHPQYEFVTMIGPQESYGVPGELTLTFYNDRLMSTSFKANCDEYRSALGGRGITVPNFPSQEVTLDRRTRFRYDQQETNCRYLWVDPVLEDEWKEWSKKNG